MRSLKELELVLSRLQTFKNPSLSLEQYATPSAIAAEWAWSMALRGEVAGKVILDAACGPGIIGLGLLLLGAKKVYFVDKDKGALQLCRENYRQIKEEYEVGEAVWVLQDISLFETKVDAVVQNPPFGTKQQHADKKFLEQAFSLSSLVYSMHKWSTRKFVEAISGDLGFSISGVWKFDFPIPAAFTFHRKPRVKVEVGLWRMVRSR